MSIFALTAAVFQKLAASPQITSLVSVANIRPAGAGVCVPLPYLVFEVSDTDPVTGIDGPTQSSRYTVTFVTAGVTEGQTQAVIDAVRATMHGQQWGAVRGAFLQDEDIEQDDGSLNFTGMAAYAFFFDDDGLIELTPSALARVILQNSLVSIRPNGTNEVMRVTPTGVQITGILTDADGNPITGGGSGDKYFVFEQGSPATTWTVTHNMSKRPAVAVVDSGGTTVFGTLTYLSDSALTINFTTAFGGKAYLN